MGTGQALGSGMQLAVDAVDAVDAVGAALEMVCEC